MALSLMNFIWNSDLSVLSVNSPSKFVLICLADMASEEGVCWPSVKLVSKRTALSVSSVRRSISVLKSKDILVTCKNYNQSGSQKSNTYMINIDHIRAELSINSTDKHSKLSTGYPQNESIIVRGGCQPDRGGVSAWEGGGVSLTPLSNERTQIRTQSNLPVVESKNELSKKDSVEDEKEKQEPGVKKLFEHWKEIMQHPRSVLDSKRRRLLSWALANYSFEDCSRAIQGCKQSAFHMGGNEKNAVYDNIELIFRNADKVEYFINLEENSSGSNILSEDGYPDMPSDGHTALRSCFSSEDMSTVHPVIKDAFTALCDEVGGRDVVGRSNEQKTVALLEKHIKIATSKFIKQKRG